MAKFSTSGIRDKVPEASTLSLAITEFPFNTVQDGWKEAPVSIEHRLVTDRQTDRHRATAIHVVRREHGVARVKTARRHWPITCDFYAKHTLFGGSEVEWLACWTQAQNGPGSNRSRDAVG